MEFMFKIGDLIKDKDRSNKRYIKCAKVVEVKEFYNGHGVVKLHIYDSSTGRIDNIWMDQYRFKQMNSKEIEDYKEMIDKIDARLNENIKDDENFEKEDMLIMNYFKPRNQSSQVVFE